MYHLPQYKTSQTTTERQTTDRRHSVPKARPIVWSAKNSALSMLSRAKNGLAVTASGEYQQPSCTHRSISLAFWTVPLLVLAAPLPSAKDGRPPPSWRAAGPAQCPPFRDSCNDDARCGWSMCVCVVSRLRGWSLVATSVQPYPPTICCLFTDPSPPTIEPVSKDVGGLQAPLYRSVRPRLRSYARWFDG